MESLNETLYDQNEKYRSGLPIIPELDGPDRAHWVVLAADKLQYNGKKNKTTILIVVQRIPSHFITGTGDLHCEYDMEGIRNHLRPSPPEHDLSFCRIPLERIRTFSIGSILNGPSPTAHDISDERVTLFMPGGESFCTRTQYKHLTRHPFLKPMELGPTHAKLPYFFGTMPKLITDYPLPCRLAQFFPDARCLLYSSPDFDAIIPWYEVFRRCIAPHDILLKNIYPNPFSLFQSRLFSQPPFINADGAWCVALKKLPSESRSWILPAASMALTNFGRKAANKLFREYQEDIEQSLVSSMGNTIREIRQETAPFWHLGGAIPFDYTRSTSPLKMDCNGLFLSNYWEKPLYWITKIINLTIPLPHPPLVISTPKKSELDRISFDHGTYAKLKWTAQNKSEAD